MWRRRKHLPTLTELECRDLVAPLKAGHVDVIAWTKTKPPGSPAEKLVEPGAPAERKEGTDDSRNG